MKWFQWITKWFGGNAKSLGPPGIGLRAALSGGAPGGWASDHREETAHNTGFNYVAIHAIAAQVAGATVTVFADGDQQSSRQSRRKSLASRVGSFTRWKSTYGADDRETDPLPSTHPLVRLLRHPNPHESGANFRYRQAQQMRLTGTCLVWNVPSVSGPTCERYVIPTAMATPVVPSIELPVGGWRINPVASRYTPIVDDGYVECPSWYRILGQIVDARQVQIIRLPHAWYLDDGQSPLSAGAKWVDAGEAVDEARYHQLKNGIDPSIVWNLPSDVSPDQDEMDRVQAKISAKYGGPENVGRVMVAQSGTSITPLSSTPKEMCYAEGFQDFKSALLALHQTPPVAVGLQEPGAYAAYNASMKAWRHSAIQPLCDMLAESDTEHLAPQFGSGLTVEMESDTVDDADLIEEQLRNDLAAKVRTKNEWRAVRGMPPLPGKQGDELVGTDSGPDKTGPTSSPSQQHDTSTQTAQYSQGNSLRPLSTSTQKTRVSNDDGFETNPCTVADGDHDQSDQDGSRIRARLIAEILYGVFGSSALSILESAEQQTKAYDPDKHPRDDRGRFASTGSAHRAEARELISRVLRGDPFPSSGAHVMESVKRLSRKELESLHREHGVTPPPHMRDRLEESVHARLIQPPHEFRTSADNAPAVSTHRTRPKPVEVYVQHAEKLNGTLGRELTHEHWGQLVGAQPGARVHVYPKGLNSVEIAVHHRDYSARRTISGNEIFNSEFDVNPKKQRRGLGAKVLSQQVDSATAHGFKRLRADAIGTGEKLRDGTKNPKAGYYAWARLGYDGRIDGLMRDRMRSGDQALINSAKDFETNFPGVKNVSKLMKTEQGRDWWKKYGGEFEAVFDLSPDSESRRVLAEYLAEESQGKKKPKSYVAKTFDFGSPNGEQATDHAFIPQDLIPDWNVQSGENPDPLTPEQEEILDRIWDEIGRETGTHDFDFEEPKQRE